MARIANENGNGSRAWLLRALAGLVATVSVVVGIAAANVWNDQSVLASAFATHVEADKGHRAAQAKQAEDRWHAVQKQLECINTKMDALGAAQSLTQTEVQIIRTVLDRIEKGKP